MKTVIVIPARLASSRLPRKVLLPIQGRPMLWHVWRNARCCAAVDAVYIATDSVEVRDTAEAWGGRVIMTSPDCLSGTHRIASILPLIEGDLIINLQADEPMLDAHSLERLVEGWRRRPCDIITLVFRLREIDELTDANIVKVVRADDRRALYFSRSPIPHVRDVSAEHWLAQLPFWGHVGVYGFRRQVLSRLPQLSECDLEAAEKLEQLRWLNSGLEVITVETESRTIAVDTDADWQRVRHLINAAAVAPVVSNAHHQIGEVCDG